MLILCGPAAAADHDVPGHPERPARVAAAMAGIDDLGLGGDLRRVAPVPASMADLRRAHDPAYLAALARFCRQGGGHVDADTFAGPGSFEAARLAAGAGLAAVEELARAGRGTAFVVARPPGHHAERDRAMGFCLVNNVAVAAARLADRGERVLVVDWDVHHGNGTQAIFWDDDRVLYVSSHQWPLYPGTGRPDEVGGARARGLTVNLPLPSGATGDVVRRALEEVALPEVERFAPTWVLVSAGFDAHRTDPLAGLALSEGDFAELARTVAGWAPRPGRVVLFLEGGYDLAALRASVAATAGAVLGAGHPGAGPTSGGPGTEQVAALRRRRAEVLAGG